MGNKAFELLKEIYEYWDGDLSENEIILKNKIAEIIGREPEGYFIVNGIKYEGFRGDAETRWDLDDTIPVNYPFEKWCAENLNILP